jgi:opacity protein-like surface antigen
VKVTKAGFTLALLLAGGTAPVAAQLGFFLGGGPTFPTSDYKDVAKTGWMGMGGVTVSLPALPIQIRGEGLYGRNSHDDTTGDRTDLYGAMANVSLSFPLGPVKPYIIGGFGTLNHHYAPGTAGVDSENEWKAVYGGGVGINFSLVMLGVFVEGRYLKRGDTSFIPVMVGIRFGG